MIPTLDQSGAERQLTLLAKELPQHGIHPSVIALNRGGYYERLLADADIPVTVLQKRFRFDPLTWVRLRRTLHQQQPDVIHSFLFSANSYVRMAGMRPASARVVVSERCVDSWKSGWQLATDRRLAGRMHAMTVNSPSVARFYQDTVGIPQDQIHMIPNAVCFDPLSETSENTTSEVDETTASDHDLRKRFGLPQDALLVAFVGRLAPQKCLHDLVWAFQLLHQAVDNVYLIIAGEGPERDRLAELATSFGCREKIFFTGHWDNSQTLLKQVNAFCLPSAFEGMSNSLMEAMLAKVPVAVSDIDANTDLVTDGITGLVFPRGDSPEMAKRLKRLLTEQPLSENLSAAAHEMMVADFSLNQLVERHVALYESLCSASAPGNLSPTES